MRDPDIVYLSGITSSAANIATAGAHDAVYANSFDGFVVRFDTDGERQWASYLGGPGEEADQRAAVTPTGELYVAGRTHSNAGLATPGAFKGYINTMGDAYLARFAADGKLQWATYYGYDGADGMSVDVASDAAGNALFAGNTMSTSGFTGIDPYQNDNMGFRDYFLAKFTPDGKRKWGTYLGGTLHENTLDGKLVAAPGTDIVYLAGSSRSAGMTTPGAFQEVAASSSAGLLVRFTQHELSSPCADQADCKAGSCVDGVCCDTPCGGDVADDCQTCLLTEGAVADGVCTVQSAAVVCRPAASACDVAESCPGDVAGCPADEFAADDTPCDGGFCAAGSCLPDAGTSETTGTDTTAGTTTAGTTTVDDTTGGIPTSSEPTTAAPTGTSAGPTVTGDPASTGADASDTAGDDASGTAGGSGQADGCSCSQGHGARDMLLAAAVLLALPRRRRR
ncbi:hypothetical protein [Nannocystis radixulma]|uniref:Disintegrin domain-containing protein n=1 Tax=Nannocystis radixulma TaxID=2995305 RepID=A0ABT5BKR3_9BACT|nr:hypothetical protein [Nannocystis radixulma]MDC0674185.1 hypothetical protein [Nannocystis radixulma]